MSSLVIYERAVKDIFVDKGAGDFVSINGEDLKRLFELYDEVIFDHKLTEKLKETCIIIEFQVKHNSPLRDKSPCAIVDLPVYTSENHNIMKVTLFPREISLRRSHINSLVPLDKANLPIISMNDNLKAIMSVFEYITVHMMMILWDTYDDDNDDNSSHGKAFQGMMKYYFNYSQMNSRLTVVRSPSLEDFEEREILDDYEEEFLPDLTPLAMIFLTCCHSFFRDALFDVEKFPTLNEAEKNMITSFQTITSKGSFTDSTITTVRNIINHYTNSRDIKLLHKQYTTTFPKMQVQNVDISRGKNLVRHFKTLSISHLRQKSTSYPYICWRRLSSPMLVFSNDHYHSGDLKTDYEFDHEILDGKYQLCSIILKVLTRTSHYYIAVIKTEKGWVYYRNGWLRLKRCLDLSMEVGDTFRYEGKNIPELLFYSLNKDYRPQSSQVAKTESVRIRINYKGDRADITVEFFNDDLKGAYSKFYPDHMISRNYWIWKVDEQEGEKLFRRFKNIAKK